MGRIKVMDQALANLIAAGEVIERPASVVKELVENAVDAGALRIAIEVERAGSRLISVTDDGCGMDEEDARNALVLHGTSKLIRAEDISTVMTMGFRGEALPSMAQISRFTMRTRQKDSPEGVELFAEGGQILKVIPCGAPAGTCIRIEDLFFNTPARKKFMKSPATEEHHIEETVILLALANPKVSFELKLDGRMAFRLPRASIEDRMRELFGRQNCSGMIPLRHKEGNLEITGFIGAPGVTRSSRRDQRFFVNRRPVDSLTISRALKDGYATLSEPGRYVPAVLFLELPVQEIDVNVHPAKREIRFRSEFFIIRAVAAAVGNALRNWGAGASMENETAPSVPDIPERNIKETSQTAAPRSTGEGTLPLKVKFLLDAADVSYNVEKKQEQPEFAFEGKASQLTDEPLVKEREISHDPGRAVPAESSQLEEMELPKEDLPEPAKEEKKTVPELALSAYRDLEKKETDVSSSPGFWPEKILGIYDDTYLLAAGKEGLLLIDQHAAHERIMFERLLDSWQKKGNAPSQGLLIPEILELPRGLLTLLTRNLEFFQQLGFDFSPAGKLTVMVNGLPAGLNSSRPLTDLVTDMLNGLLDENYTPGDLEAVARAACHAAVRAHDPLSVQGAEELLRELKNCRQGTLCPHGRPTIITLSLREIEKRFGRR
ncbi:MAG: DNA mismatch repair endonuclease MutL [Lentisphaeria bacterium]|nr:DNA mismatch repair endonuclease MutL [Lentisphaeria bacterium]